MKIFIHVLFLSVGVTSLYVPTKIQAPSSLRMGLPDIVHHSLPMASIGDSMLVCLQATSKTTVTNDPTAGMTPEEITNYISNVGGGLCGQPEIVRGSIGLALNLCLFFFGIFTVGYAVLGGLRFKLNKDVDDIFEQIRPGADARSTVAPGVALRTMAGDQPDAMALGDDNSGPTLSRSERRMKRRLKD
jgi:hypothetical protein